MSAKDNRMRRGAGLLLIAALSFSAILSAQSVANGKPGAARFSIRDHSYALGNNDLEARWQVQSRHVGKLIFVDKLHGKELDFAPPFTLLMMDGRTLSPANLQIIAGPVHKRLPIDPGAAREAERIGGLKLETEFGDRVSGAHIVWDVVARNDSDYLRQTVTIEAQQSDLAVAEVCLIDTHGADIQVAGSVKGSPMVAGDIFMGFEHPLAESSVDMDRATATISRQLPLHRGHAVTYSSVLGVAPAGQMRRAFLAYLERERAHPYRTFLHYNSWYDISYFFNQYNQDQAVGRINAFGQELKVKRGVTLDSFLFDDGWDDHAHLWTFNSGFPQGFAPLLTASRRYGAAPGIWLSPWGGYEKAKQERIRAGRQEGYEIIDGGFALSGPRYYAHFLEMCQEMVRKYGVNQVKFDGTGNANRVVAGSSFDSDFDAAIHLIAELRYEKPDLYINLTTGTWPSPFWLLYADSIWRGGEDHDYAGTGDWRQQWITYRDAQTYKNVVRKAPLFPLSALMLHGMIFAREADHLAEDPGHDFPAEVRSYFGTGTQLQEMYITPSLLSSDDWDTIAECAKWSRENASILRDTHWVGGDPAKLEVYGWASWSPKKSILVLRNPADRQQSFSLDMKKTFELPDGAVKSYRAEILWQATPAPCFLLGTEAGHLFTLAPFEVLALEIYPVDTVAERHDCCASGTYHGR